MFFEELGIIDYSMILFKVDRSNEMIDNKIKLSYGENPYKNLKQLKCTEENLELRTYYWHIGIIDYF